MILVALEISENNSVIFLNIEMPSYLWGKTII